MLIRIYPERIHNLAGVMHPTILEGHLGGRTVEIDGDVPESPEVAMITRQRTVRASGDAEPILVALVVIDRVGCDAS